MVPVQTLACPLGIGMLFTDACVTPAGRFDHEIEICRIYQKLLLLRLATIGSNISFLNGLVQIVPKVRLEAVPHFFDLVNSA